EAAVGFPPSVHRASAVRAGRAPAPLLGALGALACLIAIALFAAGAWIDGMILLGISLALVTLFVSAVRREPDSQLALLTRATVDRSRSLARLAAISARASSVRHCTSSAFGAAGGICGTSCGTVWRRWEKPCVTAMSCAPRHSRHR